jgi:hypothetical protein
MTGIKTESEIIQMYNKKDKAYRISLNIRIPYENKCRRLGILIEVNDNLFYHSYYDEFRYWIPLGYQIEKTIIAKNNNIYKAFKTKDYSVYEFDQIDVLPHYYIKYEKEVKQYMKTQFLEDLVKVICHPSRIHTFDALGFYD